MKIQRIAAFTDGQRGGNPAGVVLCPVLPSQAEMQTIAREVGYSETAFAAPQDDGAGGRGWRVRYFAPELEVPFCGHATIALGAALAREHGDGIFALLLNDASITVEGRVEGDTMMAALQSPPTASRPLAADLLGPATDLFGYTEGDLDQRIPPAIITAGASFTTGASFLVLALSSRELLAAMHYDLDQGRAWMQRLGVMTIMLVYAETAQRFHVRNAFAAGGIYEDPATGAAAAAFAGYLRECGWPHGGAINIVQGDDMGMPSRLHAAITQERGTSIRVSGSARYL